MAEFLDRPERLERLLESAETEIRRAILRAARHVQASADLREVERLLALGQEAELADRMEEAAVFIAAAYQAVYLAALRGTADELGLQLGFLPALNLAADPIARELAEESARIVSGFAGSQRAALRATLVAAGFSVPLERLARLTQLSIGLAPPQAEALARYAGVLDRPPEEGQERPPTDRMLGVYAAGLLSTRAGALALAEGQAALNQGVLEALRQATEAGLLDEGSIEEVWHTRRDLKVRGHHRSMEGQVRPSGEAFASGLGNALRYPSDPRAPGEDRFGCRCYVLTRASASAPAALA